MNTKINPFVAALVIFLLCILLVIKFWAYGMAVRVSGPDNLTLDADGNLYIGVGTSLVSYDSEGQFSAIYSLDRLGLTDFVDDFAFFKNGDVLLRRGEYKPSFADSLNIYNREHTQSDDIKFATDSRLYRCHLKSNECAAFGSNGVNFDRSFGLLIDPIDDTVYLSDTTRNILRKYSATGVELAKSEKQFFFPNKMRLIGKELYVADTNNRVIAKVQTDTASFGEVIKDSSPMNRLKAIHQQTWPYSLLKVDTDWWVINMTSSMSDGGVYVFNEHWKYVKKIELPENSDPVDLELFNGVVLITDLKQNSIYQFDLDGARKDDFSSPDFSEFLRQRAEEKAKYHHIQKLSIVAFTVIFLLVFITLYILGKYKKAPSLLKEPINTNVLNIQWIYPKKPNIKTKALMWLLFGGSMVVLAGLFINIFNDPEMTPELTTKMWPIMIPLFLLMAGTPLIIWIANASKRSKIGIAGEILILVDSWGREAAGYAEEIRFNGNIIAIDKTVVQIRNGRISHYSEKELAEKTAPILKNASELERKEEAVLQIQSGRLDVLLFVIAILGLFIYLLWSNVG